MSGNNTLQLSAVGDLEIAMTRSFDAPRQLVFDAMTKPEHLKRWFYGPDGWSLDSCDIDLRPGGAIRYVWRRAEIGSEMGMSGTLHEVVPGERMVHTEIFDQDWTGGETLITTQFGERDGQTQLTVTVRYSTKEVRDAILSAPMEQALSAGYDRLETLLPEIG